MNCQKCGTLIPEDAKFCIECGEYVADFKQEHVNTFESNKDYSPDVFDSDNINPASNNFLLLTSENDSLNKVIEKKSKKKLLLILSVVTIFIAVVSMVSVYFYNNIYLVNKQVSAVLTKVDSKSYKDAKEIYDEINNDSDNSKRTIIITSVDKKLSSRIDKLTLDYIKNDTDYSELEGWFKGLREFKSLAEVIARNESEAKKYKDSRDSMAKADEYIDKKDYIEAVKRLEKVIPEDVDNYNDAQSKIEKCTEDMYDYYIKTADKLDSTGEHEDAYLTAKRLKEYYPDDTNLKSKMDSYLKNLYDTSIKKADEYNEQKKFNDAIEIISDVIDYFPGDTNMTQKREAYITNRYKEEQEEIKRKSQRKNELLAKTSKRYDESTKATVIAPRGYSTKYVNIDNNLCIEPRIVASDSGVAAFCVITGFIDDKWVNYDKIIIEVDGDTFEWEAPLRYKNTQTVFDRIAEWSIHSNMENLEMIDQLTKMANGKEVKMIFEGDRSKSHVVTKEEKSNLNLFTELIGFYINLSNQQDKEQFKSQFEML